MIEVCKKNCPKCRSKQIKSNGKNTQWKEKFKCKKCLFCFVKKNRKNTPIRTKKVFDDWLVEGYSCRQIWKQKSKRQKAVLLNIRRSLDSNEISQIDVVFEDIHHVMIDGIRISKDICLIIYYEYIQKKVIRFWFYNVERYEYILKDLKVLRESFKYSIWSFTVDGSKQIKKAIQEVYPKARLQRCLTHIQRQTQNYISKNPQSICWKELQKIVIFENFENKQKFEKLFRVWEDKHMEYLEERSIRTKKSTFKHRRLRQARSHIKHALQYMFHFLDDCIIKRSSNDLEGYNWVLSDHIYHHRWLKKERLLSFISLWIYNRNLSQK